MLYVGKGDRGAEFIYPWKMKQILSESGFAAPKIEYISFFPPYLRALLKAERHLTRVPLGAQYLATGIKP
jgi:hypothetical protein